MATLFTKRKDPRHSHAGDPCVVVSEKVRDEVRLHRLQLAAPVGPVVRAVVREVERAVRTAGGKVVVTERLVGPDRQALQEGGRKITAAQLVRLAVTAVDP